MISFVVDFRDEDGRLAEAVIGTDFFKGLRHNPRWIPSKVRLVNLESYFLGESEPVMALDSIELQDAKITRCFYRTFLTVGPPSVESRVPGLECFIKGEKFELTGPGNKIEVKKI
jgi:hypothetical protein